MSRIVRRIRTWTKCRALSVRCAITGHSYGQHFTDGTVFASMASDAWEPPWCDRCGRDAVL